MRGLLALEDGTTFAGEAFGGTGVRAVGEVVFNTGMTGYQEVLTDPSYAGQIVAMTYPLIGNYGIDPAESESRRPWANGFIIRQNCEVPSHWGDRTHLGRYLAENGILGLAGVDTRALTRHLRRHGTLRGVICAGPSVAVADAVDEARRWQPDGLVEQVTGPVAKRLSTGFPEVVVIDYGAKENIARSLLALGAGVSVVPAHATAAEILALHPDGVLLSNGPGDPREVADAPRTIGALLEAGVPLFGICLGHQLLGLALGAKTEKMLFGHRGSNHPVIDLRSGLGVITTQNHGYALIPESLDPAVVEITHENLNDRTVEGIRHRYLPAFAVQYHPEACPGPGDSRNLFREFIDLCRAQRGARAAV